jgi:nucleotide-binding universal stress UspA family protein
MSRHNRIVVGIDGSADGLRAAEYAAVEALLRSAEIQLVHAVDVHLPVNPRVAAFGIEDFRTAGKQALDAAELRIVQVDHSIPVTSHISAGPRAQALVEASAAATLVVVGRRPVHGLRRVLSGSTSTAVAARAKSPVIAVPDSWSRGSRPRRVAVGTDGSAAGQAALDFAFAEAAHRNASVVAIRAWDVPMRWYGDVNPLARDEPDWAELAALSLAEDLAAPTERYPEIPVICVVERSPTPAALLIDRVEDAAMLVVGARGGGGILGLDLGWTARNVIAHAPCPTVVVHRGDGTGVRKGRSARSSHAGTSGKA